MSEMLCGVVSEIVPRLIGTVTTIPELKEQLITDFLAGKPSRYEEKVSYVLRFSRDNKAIHKHIRTMGWRLYATNAPVSTLSLSSAIQLHRGSPRIERDFARLKGKQLGIRPLYVQREDHIIGLVRLLSLALRVLTAIEYVVRQRLIRLNKSIAGLYAGNPKRKTNQPMTERLLKAFKGVTFTEMTTSCGTTHKHLTSLTDVQSQILRLLASMTISTELQLFQLEEFVRMFSFCNLNESINRNVMESLCTVSRWPED